MKQEVDVSYPLIQDEFQSQTIIIQATNIYGLKRIGKECYSVSLCFFKFEINS